LIIRQTFILSAVSCFRYETSRLNEKALTHGFAAQIMAGKIPYYYLDNDAQVLAQVCRGVKPLRPTTDMAEQHWHLVTRCWSDTPIARPDIGDVSLDVKTFYRQCKGDTGRLDADQNFGGKGRREPCLKLADIVRSTCIGRVILRFFGGLRRAK
jgi:hypothetical protein